MKELRKLMSTEDYIRVLETTVETDTRTIRYAVGLLKLIQELDEAKNCKAREHGFDRADTALPIELKGRLLYFLYKARRVDPLELPLDAVLDFAPEQDTRVFPDSVNMQSAILKHNDRPKVPKPVQKRKKGLEKASRPRLLRNLARLIGLKSADIYKMNKDALEASLLETYPDLKEWGDRLIEVEIESLKNEGLE